MSEWLRKDAQELVTLGYQLGLTPIEAGIAMQIGARVASHRILPRELDEMIARQYERWAADSVSQEPTDQRRHLRRLLEAEDHGWPDEQPGH